MTNLQTLFLSPRGRIGRHSYWTLVVAMIVAGIVTSLIPFFGPILSLALLWPFACLVTKRLHDAGRRAWLVPVMATLNLCAVALSFTATMMAADPANVLTAFALAAPAMMLSGLSMVVTLATVVLAGLAMGQTGANRFGLPEDRATTFATLFRTEQA